MKITLKSIFLLFTGLLLFQSCEKDNDDVNTVATKGLEIETFVWKGMNQFYLWQSEVPNLADDKFKTEEQFNTFLKSNSSPKNLFDNLLNKPKDRFSWIVDDYVALEQSFQGTTKSDGIDFGLSYKPGSTTEIFGYVRYIVPNSNAATKNIKRGDMFTGVNGTQLTGTNYESLLINAESYTLNLADYNGTTIVSNGKTIALTKTTLNENPILINKVFEIGGKKIGYLMYNGFFANYDTQLNDAFGTLKSQGITDLVLDLRYNGGGSVQTSVRLASMITGQFTGKVFTNLQWNKKNSNENENYLFTNKIEATTINSLNLSKLYVLTTKGTASASELIINGLSPYINVVQIGDKTYGKSVASTMLYDSPTIISKSKINPAHKYAMLLIIAQNVNSLGFGDYQDGLTPTFQQAELISTFGVLGNSDEPLLSLAIGKITGTKRASQQVKGKSFEFFKDSKSIRRFGNDMYIETVPKGL